MRAGLLCVLSALVPFSTPRAHAQAGLPPRLLFVRSCSELACSALEARLAAELGSLAVPLVVRQLDTAEGELAALAQQAHALAAIRVARDGTGFELWQAQLDVPSHLPGLLTIPVDPASAWSVSALTALEALRARLLDSPDYEETARVAPPIATARPSPRPRLAPWLWLRAAIGAAYSPGGLGYHSQLLASLRLQPRSVFSTSVFAALDLRASTLREPEGAALVRATLTGMVVEVVPLARRQLMAAVGAGAALAFLRVEGGAAEAGYAARSETIVGAGPVLRASAAARLTDWYLLRLELLAAITTPRAVLRFADREVATWGRPFLQLTLGAEFGLLRPTQS